MLAYTAYLGSSERYQCVRILGTKIACFLVCVLHPISMFTVSTFKAVFIVFLCSQMINTFRCVGCIGES